MSAQESTLFQPAVREKIKLRAAIDGPTGAGKTWTALQWARILAGETGTVALLDTESDSAKRYAPTPKELADGIQRVNYFDPPYNFSWRPAQPPFNPVALGHFIESASGQLDPEACLVIDSLTHFWTGEGGTLDIVDQSKMRGAFSGWIEGTPAQRYLLWQMINCRCHLIVTMRSRMHYVMEETVDSRGERRSTVQRLGMAPEQRPGIAYEFDLVASMETTNRMLISKSRIPDLMNKVAEPGRSHEIAEHLREWIAEGADRITDEQVAALKELMDSIADVGRRRAVKNEFVTTWGRPENVLDVQGVAAADWVTQRVQQEALTQPASTEPEQVASAGEEVPSQGGGPSPATHSPDAKDGPAPLHGPLADALAGVDDHE